MIESFLKSATKAIGSAIYVLVQSLRNGMSISTKQKGNVQHRIQEIIPFASEE